jgi:hypothetical protein
MSIEEIGDHHDKAMWHLKEAHHLLGGILPVVPPIGEGQSPAPAETITLPNENQLSAFYGPPGKSATWQKANLTRFNFPVNDIRLYTRTGAHLSDTTGDNLDDHRCHVKVAASLEAALKGVFETLGKTEFYRQGWHLYSGCWNYRYKRGGSSLSTHAWGIAVDINSEENPFLQKTTTFSDAAIDVMERHGWLSGGRAWGKDWMHFQRAIPFISSGSYYSANGLPDHIKPY